MAKISLCIEPVLKDLDFYDRIKIASELGYDAIEFWDPIDKDIPKIARLAAHNHVAVSICCVRDAMNLRMNLPQEIVVKNIAQSIAIAQELGCPSLIALSGDVDGQDEAQKKALIENLKRVSDMASRADVTLCMEALNSLVNHKGYYLDSSALGFDILKSVGCDQIRLLYDVYHMQIMEGNIIENITGNIRLIGHFHSAGVPGRHELMSGENDYRNILKAIDKTGYDRYFGLEYLTTYDPKQSLKDCLDYLKG